MKCSLRSNCSTFPAGLISIIHNLQGPKGYPLSHANSLILHHTCCNLSLEPAHQNDNSNDGSQHFLWRTKVSSSYNPTLYNLCQMVQILAPTIW